MGHRIQGRFPDEATLDPELRHHLAQFLGMSAAV
jgi:hypothetical protein